MAPPLLSLEPLGTFIVSSLHLQDPTAYGDSRILLENFDRPFLPDKFCEMNQVLSPEDLFTCTCKLAALLEHFNHNFSVQSLRIQRLYPS
jgi:hypothetical protein